MGAEIAKRGTRNKSAEILESQFSRPLKHTPMCLISDEFGGPHQLRVLHLHPKLHPKRQLQMLRSRL
jgi:hypothetical protein